MLKHVKHAGANVTPANFPCLPCDLTHSGGFSPDAGAVVLCQGNFLNKKHMEHTIVHELVHMYDHAVFNVDWTNLRHHACSEVRSYHAHPTSKPLQICASFLDSCKQSEWRLFLGA